MLTLIEILWDGPFKLNELKKLSMKKDYGLYQVYGTHNITGPNTLLYLGQAIQQTFYERLEQHKKEWLNYQYSDVEIYVGRLGGTNKIGNDKWGKHINMAEKLLIYFVLPPYNSSNLGTYGNFSNVVVINLGKKHRLPVEVSTFYRDSKYWESEEWKEYS